MRILIVLSHNVDLTADISALERRGFDCDVVPPVTGASRYRRDRHDVVLLAVRAEKPPLELIAMLRVLGPPRLLTLVAGTLDDALDTLLTAGVDDVLPHPCSASDLALRLEVLSKRGEPNAERARLELELERARQFQERITDTVPEHIYLFDLVEQTIAYSNHRIDDLLGFSKKETSAMGDHYFVDLMHPEDRERIGEWFARYESHRPGDPPVLTRYRMRHRDGTWRSLSSRSIVFSRRDDGRPRQVLGVVEDVTERERQEEALRRSREELRTLARHLQEAREREREAIAREIHDQLGQELTALKLHLSVIEGATSNVLPGSLEETLTAARELTGRIATSVRRIARDLRPAVIDDIGLTAAMRLHAEEMTRTARLDHDFIDDLGDDTLLDRERATHLFRIFQESLTNVLRHADAQRVDVHLRREGDAIALTVADDGRGIEPEELASTDGRVGLVGMRERALLCRGVVDVRSREGGGTVVEVRIPLTFEVAVA